MSYGSGHVPALDERERVRVRPQIGARPRSPAALAAMPAQWCGAEEHGVAALAVVRGARGAQASW